MDVMEKTLNITEQDLHSSLNDFLEEKEKKPVESIWNFTTITGLLLVFVSSAYVGHAIGTEFGFFGSVPMINTMMNIAPYFGGAMLAVIMLSAFKRKSKETVIEAEEKERVRETYDKLDEFLYVGEKQSKSKSRKKGESFKNFSIGSTHKLSRSRTDKKLAGVCGGLAKHLGMSSTVLRLIFVAALFLSFNTFILVYIALSFVIPKEPISDMDDFNNF